MGNGGNGWLHSADVVVTIGGSSSIDKTPSIRLVNDVILHDFKGPITFNPLLNDEGMGQLWSGDIEVRNGLNGDVINDLGQAFGR